MYFNPSLRLLCFLWRLLFARLRLRSFALFLDALVFEPLRFGEFARGVLAAAALLIGAGELEPQVSVVRILRDGDLQRRHGLGGFALFEQRLAEQRAGVGGMRLE